ncbi:MAG: hypothetical protein L0323_04115 [Planctomycetes bacterium]|nr:hypothetical protein [Planctomycetota bacterium]
MASKKTALVSIEAPQDLPLQLGRGWGRDVDGLDLLHGLQPLLLLEFAVEVVDGFSHDLGERRPPPGGEFLETGVGRRVETDLDPLAAFRRLGTPHAGTVLPVVATST